MLSEVLAIVPLMFAGGAFVSGCLLLKRSQGSPSRLLMSIICFAWFFVEAGFIPGMIQGVRLQDVQSRFHGTFFIYTLIAAEISLLYPYTLFLAARVRLKSALRHMVPPLALSLVYALYLAFTPVANTPGPLVDMLRGLSTGQTDPVDLALRCLLMIYLVSDALVVSVKVKRFIPFYDTMLDRNFSNVDSYAISWLRDVFRVAEVVLVLFLIYIVIPGQTLSLVIGIVHMFVLAAMLFLTVHSALTLESVDSSLFPDLRWNWKAWSWELVNPGEELPEEGKPAVQLLTEQQVKGYQQVFDEWMRITKPYTKSEFRVSDVNKKLGIGRLETNEFFNRAYHCYFRNLVQRYRIEEAIRMMREAPERQIKEISYEVGFSSQSVFARSFQNQMGMSCTRYREKMKAGEV